jgi:kynurenine formamidase
MPKTPGNTWELEIKPPVPFGHRQVGHFDFLHSEIGQNGTQFDALGHAGTRSGNDLVFYNEFTEKDVYGAKGLLHLGVEKMKPFFTRGVLVDVKRYVNNGATLSPGQEVTMRMVSETLAAQGMSEQDITEGDAVLFVTGWEENWYKGTTAYYAGVLGFPGATPGLGLEVATWLASKSVGVVGADNYAVDRVPNPDAPDGVPFPVHNELIVKSGIPLQESMRLSELADDLAVDLQVAKQAGASPEALRKLSTFAYIYVPLPIKGATGSPGLPMAVR